MVYLKKPEANIKHLGLSILLIFNSTLILTKYCQIVQKGARNCTYITNTKLHNSLAHSYLYLSLITIHMNFLSIYLY